MRAFTVKSSVVERCPVRSLVPAHYLEDGTCLCPAEVPPTVEATVDDSNCVVVRRNGIREVIAEITVSNVGDLIRQLQWAQVEVWRRENVSRAEEARRPLPEAVQERVDAAVAEINESGLLPDATFVSFDPTGIDCYEAYESPRDQG